MRRFFRQAWLNFKGQRAAFSLEEFLLLDTMYPLLTMVFYCLLASYAFHTQDLTRWVVGNAFLLCTNICVFSLGGSFMGERYYGRIRSIITAPISKLEIVAENGFFPCLVCVATTFIGFAIGSVIFQVSWKGINMLLFLFITFIAMMAASGLGMLLASIGLLSDQMHLILNLTSNLLILFCGANFPVSQLPKAGQLLSRVLPLTRSIQAAEMLMNGAEIGELMPYIAGEFLIAIVYALLAFSLIRYAEHEAIKKGTLELF